MNVGMRANMWKYVNYVKFSVIQGDLADVGLKWRHIGAALADLLHTIGRLISRHWPTYYIPLGLMMRHVPATLRGRRASLATDTCPSHVWN